jgi:pimeloyl-ACP methyl ester carboxylesterase
MEPGRRLTILGLLLICLAGLTACGGGGSHVPPTAVKVLTYRPGVALDVHVARGPRTPSLRVQLITYTSVDGQRVPGLFAIPTASAPLGCVMYQAGLGTDKEAFPQLWQGLAKLRLATFTTDPRNGGARGSAAAMEAAIKTPQTLLAMVLDTVVDLRVGLDYLETRPECHHNIAYLGTSFGGVVGAIFAGEDTRIKAAILTSIGPTFKEAIIVGNEVAPTIKGLPVQVPGAATNPALMAQAVKILGPYDPDKWVGQISPRPLMLINGRDDPLVLPIDALDIAAAAGNPKTVLYFNGGHNPFAPGPGLTTVDVQVAQFLVNNLGLPNPL